MKREGKHYRKTKETEIDVRLVLDGEGRYEIHTGIPFMDHMLAQLSRHGLFDLEINAKGDTEIDGHHTVEDLGITLGESFKKALGEGKGIRRFGMASIPLDEALASVSLDISGRAHLSFPGGLPKEKVGNFDVELVEEFFRSFTSNAGITLHIRLLSGNNLHHILESIFKSFARALDEGTRFDERVKDVPSTKGVL
ncbi:MAG: imidazoleglycerol-phosphate dehydratase HisB [Nitrospinae bacterium]|nr:imidazoleglycerol-phosphate dehydratase HisB [Nitrospinota bacterium]